MKQFNVNNEREQKLVRKEMVILSIIRGLCWSDDGDAVTPIRADVP